MENGKFQNVIHLEPERLCTFKLLNSKSSNELLAAISTSWPEKRAI